jgi:hypothetical protein
MLLCRMQIPLESSVLTMLRRRHMEQVEDMTQHVNEVSIDLLYTNDWLMDCESDLVLADCKLTPLPPPTPQKKKKKKVKEHCSADSTFVV